jgi:hypothetical protein
MSRLSSRIEMRHKLVLMICLLLSIYTVISSETLSLLMGFNRSYNTINNNLMNGHKRGVRNNDENGVLLNYHLPNLSDYQIHKYYEQLIDGKYCLIEGTNWTQTQTNAINGCICVNGYFGNDCGIPSIVFNSLLNRMNMSDIVVKRVSKPKRIVLSVVLFPTYDSLSFLSFMNNSFHSLSNFIDLFIINQIQFIQTNNNNNSNNKLWNIYFNDNKSANNSTNSTSNNLIENSYGLKEILNKELKQFSDIVLFESIGLNLEEVVKIDINEFQNYVLSNLWTLVKRRVSEFRPNDIICFTWNSFPILDVIKFVKHYEIVSQPIKLASFVTQSNVNNYSLNLSRFYDPVLVNNNNIMNIALTFEYLSLLCRYDFELFLKNECMDDKKHVQKFVDTYGPIDLWTIGNYSLNASATFYCSNCFI